ncbi:rCG39658, isoform CRA_c [Rattus norvegicus]|uniref:RCG39658, isoform CRA_c n=1 Tax=Rattus norvegicus TaxID=10116 RepID=A6I8E3_RAT|nr:rCG39658, isoform CRA_c [Rattus norvegicus]
MGGGKHFAILGPLVKCHFSSSLSWWESLHG